METPPGRQAAIDEPIGLEAPGANIVVSGGEEAVPAVLAPAPASATSILIDWEPVPDATPAAAAPDAIDPQASAPDAIDPDAAPSG